MWRLLGYSLYVLWCLSWFPTLVGLLSERPGAKPTPQETVIRLLCLANALTYYIGGIIWLARRSSGRRRPTVWLAWVVFVLWNVWGPVVLALSGVLLGKRESEGSELPAQQIAPAAQPHE